MGHISSNETDYLVALVGFAFQKKNCECFSIHDTRGLGRMTLLTGSSTKRKRCSGVPSRTHTSVPDVSFHDSIDSRLARSTRCLIRNKI